MTDLQFIDELKRAGVLNEENALKARRESELTGKPVELILYDKKLVDEQAVIKVKSALFGMPYKKVDIEAIPDALFSVIPQATYNAYKVIPIEQKGRMLVVGMFRPDDEKAQNALKFIAKQQGMDLGVYLISFSDWLSTGRRYNPYKSEVSEAVKSLGNIKAESAAIDIEEAGKGEDAPVIKIVASTLKEAVQAGASDIHVEPQRNTLRIRFRTDGVLHDVSDLPAALTQPIVSRIKVLAKLKLDETRIPQDGRFRTSFQDHEIDYRVSTFPTPAGEKVAIRVLDPKTGLRSLEQLGISEYNAKIINEALSKPFGMLLISGPTGSGKSTTLYAMMSRLNKESVNIVTLEDPVEYFMEGINQSQVRPEIEYTFASGLREILRQDPDVIMVGEIRDGETASLAVNAALTGHIMLSTIHTNNAIGVVPRLVDLGVPPFLLSSALNLMIAQRLALRLCPDCRVAEQATPEIEAMIDESLDAMPKAARAGISFAKPYTVYSVGSVPECPTCKGKGTAGRIALYEIFRMTRELGELINKGFTEGALADEGRRQGMMTLRQDAIVKLLEGKVSVEEVLKETV